MRTDYTQKKLTCWEEFDKKYKKIIQEYKH